MISITRLTQAMNNLEQDLKRVYETAYKRIESEDNPDVFGGFINLTEDECLEQIIKENYGKNPTDEELNELKDSAHWKAFSRLIRVMKRVSRYFIPFPKVAAATLTIIYDYFVHPILFSNWHWNDYDDIDSLGLNLSSDEIYDGLKNCNPDVVSVFLSKLENCSVADRESLQEAYNNAQKEVFVNKLKTIPIKDYNHLVSVTAFSHYENALISLDIDTLRILFYHIDFGEDFNLDSSLMIDEDLFELKGEEYGMQLFPNDDASEEEWIAAFNNFGDKIESHKDHLVRGIYSTLKYGIPIIFEAFKPFPFERKYLDDVLSIPEVKSILDELPENPEKINMAPEDQEQPEPQRSTVPPVDHEPNADEKPETKASRKESNAGAPQKHWIKVPMTECEIKKKLEEEVWTGIVGDIEALDYSEKSDIEKGKASKAFGAAIIFYSANSLGLTDSVKYGSPAERAFSFLPAPRTSVNEYLDKLYKWYDKLIKAEISKKGNLDEKVFKRWKSEDSFRANFIIINYGELKELVKKTKFLLGKAFGVETGLKYESQKIESDPVLGGALLYNDEVENKDDGSKILTGRPLSDSYDKQLGK